MMTDQFWRGGDRVEVERIVSGATAYFPATVVNAPSIRKNLVWVEHEALMVGHSVRMKEYVIPTRLRPSPPRELNRNFKAGDEVDVFRDSEGCWVRGDVMTVLGDLRYIVRFNGDTRPETEVDHFDLRLHRDWEDGIWVPSLLQLGEFVDSMPKSVKLKINLRRDEYNKGDTVEVRSEEEAYTGSWYCARVVSLICKDKYIVEHLRFGQDGDESIPLRDLVEAQNMRPVPPPLLSPVVRHEPGDEVDAWFDTRWWTGRICKVLEGGYKYLVYFGSTGEELVVLNFNLRPHKDWISGQWDNQCCKPPSKNELKSCERTEKVLFSKEECFKPPSKKRRRSCERVENVLFNKEECLKPPSNKKLKSCGRVEKVMFSNGMLVEVRSDERGYEGSWFSAKIISYLGENSYTVEYQTLRTDDEMELLREEARGSDIRPPPPPLIQKACRYELNEYVDAWFNEGWWAGRVFMINDNYTRYGVYFQTTGERLEFAYGDLRPCQVWIKGKWSRALD